MAEQKAPRPIAGDVGTDNRIDCDDGHYWVRLVTKAAIRREGDAMRNCLRDGGYDDGASGPESFDDISLWSLRAAAGESIALGSTIKATGHVNLGQFHGPMNNTPSATAYRQLRYLVAAFENAGHKLELQHRDRDEPIVVTPDGRTFRWDRAPKEHRRFDHEERMAARRQVHEDARRRREAAQRIRESQPPIPEGDPGAELVGEPINLGDGITVTPRADGCFYLEGRSARGAFVASRVHLSPFPDASLAGTGQEAVRLQANGFMGEDYGPRHDLIVGPEFHRRLRAAQSAAGVLHIRHIDDPGVFVGPDEVVEETFEARSFQTLDGRTILGPLTRRVELRRLWEDYASGRTR